MLAVKDSFMEGKEATSEGEGQNAPFEWRGDGPSGFAPDGIGMASYKTWLSILADSMRQRLQQTAVCIFADDAVRAASASCSPSLSALRSRSILGIEPATLRVTTLWSTHRARTLLRLAVLIYCRTINGNILQNTRVARRACSCVLAAKPSLRTQASLQLRP
jgi:hypothetical protein